jgi:hypothetical protein
MFSFKERLVYKHEERHYVSRTGWLRAAVLGANDGIISVSSLVIGVAAAAANPSEIWVAGVAGLVAGAMSMAAGEYVSVCSQSDLENADLERERKELAETPDFELQELADIYIGRGVEPELAREVYRGASSPRRPCRTAPSRSAPSRSPCGAPRASSCGGSDPSAPPDRRAARRPDRRACAS